MREKGNFSSLVIFAGVLGLTALPRGGVNEQPRPLETFASSQNNSASGRSEKDRDELLRRFDKRDNALDVIGEFFGDRRLFLTTRDLRRFFRDVGFPAMTDPLSNPEGKMVQEIELSLSSILKWEAREQGLIEKFSQPASDTLLFDVDIQDQIVSKKFQIDVILVTIPDPEESHFAYVYDRQVEAIKRAADQNNFLLDRYWTPWETAAKRLAASTQKESDLERGEEERRKKEEPGLLLFRKGYEPKLLAVFLIGETPTAGINKEAFWRALEYRSRLLRAQSSITWEHDGGIPGTMEPPLTIVSPTFSGSLPSLRLALVGHRDKIRVGEINIINGSAQNPLIEEELEKLSNGQFKVNYYTTKISQDVQGACFKTFYEGLRIPRERVAVIREDSSFGRAGTDAPPRESKYVLPENTFPVSMHVSRIRAAYEQDPTLRLRQRPSGQSVPRQTLELKIEEPGDPRDSPESFSMMTSESEELVLANLLTHISHKNYKLLGIIMTDTRDILFLGRLIERYCPNVRIFTFVSDVAYSHPDYLSLFYGMLAIADYPLFGLEELSTRQGDRIPAHYFANASAEGVYYAATMAIGGQSVRKCLSQSVRAPWIGIQSAEGIWPVSVPSLPSGATIPPQVPSWTKVKETVEKSLVIRPPLSFWIAFLGFLGFGTVHGVSLWNWRRQQNPLERWPFWRRFRWSMEVAPDVRAEEIIYGLSSTGSLVVALFFFGSIFKSLNEHPGNNGAVVPIAWIASWFGAFVLGLLSLPPRDKIDIRIARLKLHLAAGIGLVIAFSVCFVWIASVVLWRSEGLLLYRIISLSNGVTPVVPLLILMIGLYIWSVGQLARISDYEERYISDPLGIPNESGEGPHLYLRDFDAFRKEIGRGMGRFVFSARWFQVTAAMGLVSALYLSSKYLSRQLALSIEGPGFDLLFLGSAIVSAWLGTWGFARMIYLWKQIQRLLRQLDLLPMRDAFSEIGKCLCWKSIWLLETQHQTLSVRTAAIDCLRLLASPQGKQSLTVRRLDEIQVGIRREHKSLEEFWKMLMGGSEEINRLLRSSSRVSRKIEDELSKAAEILLTQVLFECWNSGGVRNPLMIERLEAIEAPYKAMAQAAQATSSTSVEAAEHGRQAASKSSPVACLHWLKLSEQFVALRFAAYIRPILLQIRNLVTTLTAGFLLLLVVITSYPFQPHRLLLTIQWGILLITVAGVMGVLVQMQRDPILSRLTGTQAGKVDWNREFFGEIFKYGIVPIAGLLAAEFPQLGSSLFSWVEPLLRGIR